MHPQADLFIRYAESFLGVPYLYGGNNRLTGLDCSALICELLRAVGLVGNFEDLSAQGIYEKFKLSALIPIPPNYPSLSLIFYGRNELCIDHVALSLSPYTLIECGGGNSKTLSLDEAKRVGACVRERAIRFRRDEVAVIYPPYPWENL